MKNNILCLILIPTFAALYASCRFNAVSLGVIGIAGIIAVMIGALIK